MGIQNYDDIVAEYNEGIAEYSMTLFDPSFKGICVDIGAYDPIWLSNSWIFEKEGWDCHCVEPNPRCIPRLQEVRKNVYEYACGDKNEDDVDFFVYTAPNVGEASGTGLIKHEDHDSQNIYSYKLKVKVRTLDWLMENEFHIDHIDYLSIDVEHSEMAVLRGANLIKWNPKIIVIEDISMDGERREWLERYEYRCVHRIVVNDIYIQNLYYYQNLVWDEQAKRMVFRHNWGG